MPRFFTCLPIYSFDCKRRVRWSYRLRQYDLGPPGESEPPPSASQRQVSQRRFAIRSLGAGNPRFLLQEKTGIKARQHAPPCQLRAPVNRRKRRFRSRIHGLQREPWGYVVDPDDALPKTETAGKTSTCEMFGISGAPEGARVKLNGCAGSTYGTVAPLSQPSSNFLRSPALWLCADRAMTKAGQPANLP